jgi:hypothetical protein
MRTWTWIRPCGHKVQSISKKVLTKPCNDCTVEKLKATEKEKEPFYSSLGCMYSDAT